MPSSNGMHNSLLYCVTFKCGMFLLPGFNQTNDDLRKQFIKSCIDLLRTHVSSTICYYKRFCLSDGFQICRIYYI